MWSSACAALLGSSPLLPTNHRDSPRRVPPPVPTVNHKISEPTGALSVRKTAPGHIDLGALQPTRSGASIRPNRTVVWWGEVGKRARGMVGNSPQRTTRRRPGLAAPNKLFTPTPMQKAQRKGVRGGNLGSPTFKADCKPGRVPRHLGRAFPVPPRGQRP